MNAATSSLAQALLQATNGRKAIKVAASMRPVSLADGYKVQAETAALSALELAGWKIGSTNVASQHRRGIEEPLYGRLFAELSFATPARLHRADFIDPHIEAEFGFLIARDLPAVGAPYALDAVTSAIGALVPSVEIADGRCGDWRNCDAAMAVADNIAHGCVVTGRPLTNWQPQPLCNAAVTVAVDGAVVATGRGEDVLGEPLHALLWLANALARDGHGLRAGELVISGTCTGLVALGTGKDILARFDKFGDVAATFDG